LLDRGGFTEAVDLFDRTMKKALPPEQLRSAWASQVTQYGAFQRIERTRSTISGKYHVVFVTCEFEKQQLDVKVVYQTSGRIAGLFFLPTQHTVYRPPEYVNQENFREVEVEIGEAKWRLPGTLSIPHGTGPFPAVVLVHGSGPQDRDVTIGPNKPFRDLAWGLSSKGIAVLRYEKRTKTHAEKLTQLEEFTVQEETVQDALAAVMLLKKRTDIREDQLFVLGHSLGGMLLPRIAEGQPGVIGFIFMAAPARPLEDLILEQTEYQASLVTDFATKAVALMQVAGIRKQVDAIKALSETDDTSEMLLGAPASYWRDLATYQPPEASKEIRQRMLFLQGEKDCQVSPEKDVEAWRQVLGPRKNVTFRLYPTLNHLMMHVEGQSTGQEYQLPGNVSAEVVTDLIDWILKP